MRAQSLVGVMLIIVFLSGLSALRIDKAHAVALDVRFDWKPYPIERGGTSALIVTGVNREAQLIQLIFVGVGFDWMKQDVYVYSPESATPKNVTQYASVSVEIGFGVPDDVQPGLHDARVLVDWATLTGDTWNRTAIVYLIKNVEIVIKSQGGGIQPNTTTIAIIIIVAAILVLERKRIQAFVGKRIRREARPSKPPEELE